MNSGVSIIMPCHNAASFISRTIRSAVMQIVTDWELIIADDASTDESVELVRFFAEQDKRIKLIKLTHNSDAAAARNAAIKAAQKRYIAFLDSDDIWSPHKLEHQLAFSQKNNFPFTYTAYNKVDPYGRVFGHVNVPASVTYGDYSKCVQSVA